MQNFSTKTNLKTHEKTCNKKQSSNLLLEKDRIIEQMKIIIKENEKSIQEKNELINRLINMIQPVNNTNNTNNNTNNTTNNHHTSTSNTQNNQKINNIINNLVPITEDYMNEQSKHLNIEYIKRGTDGYIDYALEYHFKDKILCVDFARKKIKYKNSDGDIIDDLEMVKLSQKFFKAIENANTELIGTYITELGNELENLNTNSSNNMNEDESQDFELVSNDIIDKTFLAMKQRREVQEAADGKKPELYYDFVKNICSRVTPNK